MLQLHHLLPRLRAAVLQFLLLRCHRCERDVCRDCLNHNLCQKCYDDEQENESNEEDSDFTKMRTDLHFSPTAWAKLLFLGDFGQTEVGGFGIAATFDPLLVTDVALVGQTCTMASVVFNDAAVADFFDRQVDLGLRPAQFGRIWVHTHPGNSVDRARSMRKHLPVLLAVPTGPSCSSWPREAIAMPGFNLAPDPVEASGLESVWITAKPLRPAIKQPGKTSTACMFRQKPMFGLPVRINAEVPWHVDRPPLFGEVRDLILSDHHEFNGEEHGYGY